MSIAILAIDPGSSTGIAYPCHGGDDANPR
jgi:hypothetical protein